jgi:hypothetical protein
VASHASPYEPGLIAAYFRSSHGQRSSYVRLATPQGLDLGLGLRTGHEPGGLTAAAAPIVVERRATR